MSWIEIQLLIPESKLDEISAYLFAMGCEGINMKEDELLIYFSKHKWNAEARLGITEYIRHHYPQFSEKNIHIKSIADQDWNKSWKDTFRALRITKQVVVRPPWEEYKKSPGDIPVVINPKMAFGTGHHESTQLAALAIEKYMEPGMEVLDVGTGSGILAIISEKMGAETVDALDIDATAIENAIENTELNDTGKITLHIGTLENRSDFEYDLVIANINRNVILNYAPLFPNFMKLNGKLIISGVLTADEITISKRFNSHGLKKINSNTKREWLCVTYELIKKENAHEKSSD